MTTMPLDVATVDVCAMTDGLLVRLRGRLDAGTVPALRHALLRVRPEGCDDVLVDAGAVDHVDDAALAVLVAAPLWAEATGGRMAYTALSRSLADLAGDSGVAELLPRLASPGQRHPVD